MRFVAHPPSGDGGYLVCATRIVTSPAGSSPANVVAERRDCRRAVRFVSDVAELSLTNSFSSSAVGGSPNMSSTTWRSSSSRSATDAGSGASSATRLAMVRRQMASGSCKPSVDARTVLRGPLDRRAETRCPPWRRLLLETHLLLVVVILNRDLEAFCFDIVSSIQSYPFKSSQLSPRYNVNSSIAGANTIGYGMARK